MKSIMKTLQILIGILAIQSCASTADENKTIDHKDEIAKVEKEFANMAAQKGIAEAFAYFADSSGVIKRGKDSLITGKDGIRNFYSSDFYKSASVEWSPDYIDVSADGTLAYTYGKYLWQSKDSSGKINEARGIFHTVWKKQKDGSWKYVWD